MGATVTEGRGKGGVVRQARGDSGEKSFAGLTGGGGEGRGRENGEKLRVEGLKVRVLMIIGEGLVTNAKGKQRTLQRRGGGAPISRLTSDVRGVRGGGGVRGERRGKKILV